MLLHFHIFILFLVWSNYIYGKRIHLIFSFIFILQSMQQKMHATKWNMFSFYYYYFVRFKLYIWKCLVRNMGKEEQHTNITKKKRRKSSTKDDRFSRLCISFYNFFQAQDTFKWCKCGRFLYYYSFIFFIFPFLLFFLLRILELFLYFLFLVEIKTFLIYIIEIG